MTSPSASAATIALFATLIVTTCPVASRAADEMVTPEQIPMRTDLTIGQVVVGDTYRGDYEFTQSIGALDRGGIEILFSADVKDDAGIKRCIAVSRQVAADDIEAARMQVLGYHTDDPIAMSGSTSIGPSLQIMRGLAATGSADIDIRNYLNKRDNNGTLQRVEIEPIAFPVLLNGQSRQLAAVHAVGQLGVPGSMRWWDLLLLDHPVQPITLRISYGPDNGERGAPPEWVRQVIRIDFLGHEELSKMEVDLEGDCRVRVPGVYFEFDSDVLNPASEPALRLASTILQRHPDWTVAVEGHTDIVGNRSYNLDLSSRRAQAFKTALVDRFGIEPARLATAGYGFDRPVATNDTVEGRAENRRVELVRPCGN